jgi:uncharacterized DUF497 family protein
VIFEWDEAKGSANFAKHRVEFEEAKTVFDDPLNVLFFTTPSIQLTNIGSLSLDRLAKAGC